jgi:hypothetical protein
MKQRLYSATIAAASILALCAFSHRANADTVSISSETDYGTGAVPLEGDAAPADSSGTYATGVFGNDGGSSIARSPYIDNTPFYSDSSPSTSGPGLYYNVISAGGGSSGSATYNLGGATTFTFLWGSPDTYNVVTFWSGANGGGTQLFTTGASGNTFIGSDLGCYATTCGSTSAALVTFTASVAGSIGSVELADTGAAAFEFGTVTPLPAALPLFATGLGALGLLGWRRKRKNTVAVPA